MNSPGDLSFGETFKVEENNIGKGCGFHSCNNCVINVTITHNNMVAYLGAYLPRVESRKRKRSLTVPESPHLATSSYVYRNHNNRR